MNGNVKSPFDKELAEGSRETVDRQLEKESRQSKSKHQDERRSARSKAGDAPQDKS